MLIQKINFIALTGFSIVGFTLYFFDKKRISNPSYKLEVQKKRDEMEVKKKNELRYLLLAFPTTNNTKDIENFVIREVIINFLQSFSMKLINIY